MAYKSCAAITAQNCNEQTTGMKTEKKNRKRSSYRSSRMKKSTEARRHQNPLVVMASVRCAHPYQLIDFPIPNRRPKPKHTKAFRRWPTAGPEDSQPQLPSPTLSPAESSSPPPPQARDMTDCTGSAFWVHLLFFELTPNFVWFVRRGGAIYRDFHFCGFNPSFLYAFYSWSCTRDG